MEDLKYIIESLVFVSETPLSVNHLKSVLETVDSRDIKLALAELQGEYEDRQGGFLLQEVAGGFQFRTRAPHSAWIKKLLKPSPTRLSRAALETLAIIAYKQPIIRADVEHIRGVDSGGVLRMLLERKLIRVLGRKDIPGRPMIYGTTKAFLELFNLKDLSELPSPSEITSLGAPDADDQPNRHTNAPPEMVSRSTAPASTADGSGAVGGDRETPLAAHAKGPEQSTDPTRTANEPSDKTFAGSGGGLHAVTLPDDTEGEQPHDTTIEADTTLNVDRPPSNEPG
jgi:segregation and condensation protein B